MPYHKKRRKGQRKFFKRTKNDTRKRSSRFKIESLLSGLTLPLGWKYDKLDSHYLFYSIRMGENDTPELKKTITLNTNQTWYASASGRVLPESSGVLAICPSVVCSSDDLMKIVEVIDRAVLCPGNPDHKFVSLCEARGGTIHGDRGYGDVVAVVDSSSVADSAGQRYGSTVRRSDCDILCMEGALRCSSCQRFRSTLRSSVSRHSKRDTDSRTQSESHTGYHHLTSSEKDDRLRNLHSSLRSVTQHVRRLETKVQALIKENGVSLHSEDADDIATIVRDVSHIVKDTFAPDSPQRVFWEQQQLYNRLQDKRQMRWHPLMIRFAMNLKYLSSSAYRGVMRTGLIALPSERTLVDYTHWTTPHSGVQYEFIEQLKSEMNKDISNKPHHCALLMDEMKIKSGLVFNKHNGTLTGFVDLGNVVEDIERALNDEPCEKELASYAFVFMARAIFKPTLAIPIAHYFSSSLSAEKIFPLAWEVIESLELYDIHVATLTSDGARQNRRFYSLCRMSAARDVPYKTTNSYRKGKEIYFMCDVPHLLKTARNCFSNSFSHKKSRKMQRNGQTISWKAIESLYLTETSTSTMGVRLCHKLTRDHVWLTSYTRMRVYLAAQVMSESVACGLEYLDNDGTQQTRLFIRMIDTFFDCLNVKSGLMAKVKRKDQRKPYKSAKDERFKWLTDVFLKYLEDWEQEVLNIKGMKRKEQRKMCLSNETLEGMRITVKSFTELTPKLLVLPGVEYVLSEVFSQDPLERYFSKQRHRGGSNENPMAHQVPYNAFTLMQQRATYRDIQTMNIQPENGTLDDMAEPLMKRQRRSGSVPLQSINS